MPEPARVLLLEDDPLVRRFVQAALDGMALELLTCGCLAEARETLSAQKVQLVLTDLHLPDGSGMDLLHWLREQGHTCRAAVFSGGVGASLQQRMLAQGVWRVLHKPVSVGDLIQCVEQGLTGAQSAPAPGLGSSDVVELYFGGDQALYESYRKSCLELLAKDVDDGDWAAGEGDAVVLHRVAHNLKSVLALLGHEQGAQWARSVEECAAQGEAAPMRAGWLQLRQQVLDYCEQHQE